MNHGWETLKGRQIASRLKSVREEVLQDPQKEMRFREYRDAATGEIIIRVIPHTGVVPHAS